MVREIEFDISEINRIYVSCDEYTGWYTKGRRLFAGYNGENEATRLTFTFGADFDGYTVSLLLDVDGTQTTVHTDTEDFSYDIPSAYMVPELLVANIKAVSGTQILYSRDINLQVDR